MVRSCSIATSQMIKSDNTSVAAASAAKQSRRGKACSMSQTCPSAPAEAVGSVAFGVIQGSVEAPAVAYLQQAVVVTADLIRATSPVSPNEVLRTAAPCLETSCTHFRGDRCTLVERIVAHLPETVSALPRCAIRPACRWWQQEGVSACRRCPQVVTKSVAADRRFEQAVGPIPA